MGRRPLVDDSLTEYRKRHGITKPWETRERVVVALSGAPAGFQLIRRGAWIAQRANGELIGVHVIDSSGLASARATAAMTESARNVSCSSGGEYRRVTGNDIGAALVDAARAENATQIVLGATNRSRRHEIVNGSVINRVVRLSGPIDVHVISERPDEGPESKSDGTERGERRLPSMKPVLTPLSPEAWGGRSRRAACPC